MTDMNLCIIGMVEARGDDPNDGSWKIDFQQELAQLMAKYTVMYVQAMLAPKPDKE